MGFEQFPSAGAGGEDTAGEREEAPAVELRDIIAEDPVADTLDSLAEDVGLSGVDHEKMKEAAGLSQEDLDLLVRGRDLTEMARMSEEEIERLGAVQNRVREAAKEAASE